MMVVSLAIGAAVILGAMSGLWLLSLALRDSSIVDIFWGPGFVAAGGAYFLSAGGRPSLPQRLLLGMLILWGVRLATHIYLRNRGRGEDFRYRRWRRAAGARWWWQSYFKVFLLQGALMWIISSPLAAAMLGGAGAEPRPLALLGMVVWGIGFATEAVADAQLRRFKADPDNAGKLLTSGLWRTSRHPNYFGEALLWWGFYLFAAAYGGAWTVFSPLLMTFLLLRVSGVRLLERSLRSSKPGYERYIQSTSAFIPWFPRKLQSD